MGLFDKLRKKKLVSQENQYVQENKKVKLIEEIMDFIFQIERINSFDSSIWNLANTNTFNLKRKSLEELTKLHTNLQNRLSELNRQSQRGNPEQERIERAKWTGEKPQNVSSHDLDWSQR